MMTMLLLLFAIDQPLPAWYVHYENGVALIEKGIAKEALADLEAALREHPVEGLQIEIRSRQFVDYLPHLYLAIASQMSGDVENARSHLAAAAKSGVASKSEVGQPLLTAYQLLLRGEMSKASSQPRYSVSESKPPVPSEQNFGNSKPEAEALGACRLPRDRAPRQGRPWYVPYEIGLQLERSGDPARAVDRFVEALERRPAPQSKTRTYGMWMVDYYPYFHIARAHAQLGNWECVERALAISERLGEISIDAREFNEFLALKQRAGREVGQ